MKVSDVFWFMQPAAAYPDSMTCDQGSGQATVASEFSTKSCEANSTAGMLFAVAVVQHGLRAHVDQWSTTEP